MDIDQLVADLDKRFGDGTIMRMDTVVKVPTIPTGSLALDLVLGGGLPKGRIIEIYGPEASGKSTLCLHAIAEMQKTGGTCAFIDMEHALDPVYATRLGVDMASLLFSQPDSGETALEIVETFVRSGLVDLVVVDSVAALVPQTELEGDMGSATMGMQARLMSQALRKLSGVVNRTQSIVIFTNQLRMKIGQQWGNPETTSGGMALKFYASQRMDIRRIQALKKGEDVIGGRTRVRVVKNKIAPPYRVAEFDILYGEGISKAGEILDLGVKAGVVTKRGAYFYYGDERIGQGRENARQALKDNPELAEALDAAIRSNSTNLDFTGSEE